MLIAANIATYVMIIPSFFFEILKKALQTLTKEEYRIIHCLYLSKSPISEKEIAKHLGMTQQAVSKRKRAIFEKLKKFF